MWSTGGLHRMSLRDYQQECVNDVMRWVRSSIAPAVVEASVGFGKTRVIAAIAHEIVRVSKKKVLILCPNGVLAKQNAQAAGPMVSVFSSSLGKRSLRHDVVVGTPMTLKNHLARFGPEFSAILIDEGEGLTQSVISTVNHIKERNTNARVIGFTGTPFRTGTGFVYALDIDGKPVPDTQTIDPFYRQLIHRTTTRDLMDMGYLTPMVVGDIHAPAYETRGLHLNKRGRFDAKEVARTYLGRGRETSRIVEDIVAQAHGRGQVMVFAASIDHCHEVMESMPDGYAVAIHGKKDNKRDLEAFRRGRYKCVVNVDMLTVGADFPRVDTIALLRKTESARLLQQILGRGVRLHPDVRGGCKEEIAASEKPYCLLLDYTEDNSELHYPDGDLWNPVIRTRVKGDGFEVTCKCPDCGGENVFSGRKNDDGFDVDENGYFVDLEVKRINTEHGPIPAHYGRRCLNFVDDDRCDYRWSSKECLECSHDNDIAARRCEKCKAEIVDPNAKLIADFKAMKRDPTQVQTDKVVDWSVTKGVSQAGNEQYRINWKTEYRSFPQWVPAKPSNQFQFNENRRVMSATQGLKVMPETITYQKKGDRKSVV